MGRLAKPWLAAELSMVQSRCTSRGHRQRKDLCLACRILGTFFDEHSHCYWARLYPDFADFNPLNCGMLAFLLQALYRLSYYCGAFG